MYPYTLDENLNILLETPKMKSVSKPFERKLKKKSKQTDNSCNKLQEFPWILTL